MAIEVVFLPQLAQPDDLAGRSVVVIDVLRATTTITQALAVGATAVIPCLEITEARRIAGSFVGPTVLGGERGGQRIDGFDLGNSPAEYTAQSVGGKTLIFTTTNGTRAMQHCRHAESVFLGSFNNLSAVARVLASVEHVSLLCAGTDGHVTREDVLFAGALIHRLNRTNKDRMKLRLQAGNDEAALAEAAWNEIQKGSGKALENGLRSSRGGRNLIALGMERDIEFAAQIDTTEVVGQLKLDEWRIARVI